MTDHATPHDSAAPAGAGAPPAPPAPFAPPAAPANPPAEAAPGADPWAVAPGAGTLPSLPPPSPEELAARRTRRRNAALRWGAAALVCVLAGTGAALAVTAPERTDIPGLATRGDGRYTFPALVLPPLPSGQAAPGGSKSRHAADLRYLLLPAPKEAGGSSVPAVFPTPTATPTATLTAASTAAPTASPAASSPAVPDGAPASAPAATGGSAAPTPAAGTAPADWVACDAMAAEQKEPVKLRALLLRDVCRAATVREWTASDGTRTQIRLLRFGSSVEAWDVFADLRGDGEPKDLPGLRPASVIGWDSVSGVDLATRESTTLAGEGRTTGYLAYLSAGDIVGVITMTNARGVQPPAFRQVVTLQSDLLA
ncbi:hypothetical protein ACFWA9_32920 [Kitasatospora sp. NPDC059973]|uniref:hypothetical protein n=1 Tax=Kitasatospora sp. NPDC059973 TaxID=3347020 RepID=UPI0036BE0BB5